MAFTFTSPFTPEAEERMRRFYDSLSEKDARRYAAVQAANLGHGGIAYISQLLGCSRRTIERAMAEVEALPEDPAEGRVRRPGGGRKKKVDADPQLEANLNSVLEIRIAGDPDDEDCLWTNFSAVQIADLVDEMGTPVSPWVVLQWLKDQRLSQRKMAKVLPGGTSPDRDAQFQRIDELKNEYFEAELPVFSIDTKAKEHLGRLYREGRVWTQQPFAAFDHDFPSWADGVIVPHGIYDVIRNRGHVNIGLSRDTSEFACDSFRWYWNRIGKQCYPGATSILWLCDGGGSNSASQYLFKQDLQRLVDDLGVEIRIAHYPSYCSKYNPIERRFFPHLGRACAGVLFDSLDTVVGLMRTAATKTGLKTTVNVINKIYETGRKVAADFKENMTIVFDDLIPKWNYRAVPR